LQNNNAYKELSRVYLMVEAETKRMVEEAKLKRLNAEIKVTKLLEGVKETYHKNKDCYFFEENSYRAKN
jgi:hypothetical protein